MTEPQRAQSRFEVGTVKFTESLPAPEGVQVTGGGRAVTVRRTLSGAVVTLRAPFDGVRTITVKSSGLQVISVADARALLALYATGEPFAVVEDYSAPDTVTYPLCVFAERPKFPNLDSEDALWCGYDMTITEAG